MKTSVVREAEPRAGDAAARAEPALGDQTIRVETPELVTIELPLAGLGSRFSALLLDTVVLFLLVGLLPLLVALMATWLRVTEVVPTGVLYAVWILYAFVGLWGYFIYFEGLRDGQTPGKKIMRVRVVMEGGHPLTFHAAAIRNLIRFVDVQPLPSCLVGGLSMMLSARAKRLGDFAAGTVVVRELPITFPQVEEVGEGYGAPLLSDDAYRALELFIDRLGQLDGTTAGSLARQVLSKMPAEALKDVADAGREIDRARALYAQERARRHAARLALKAGSPAAAQLLRARRSEWESFRRDVQGLRRRGLGNLGESGVGRFAARYRELTADLSRARTYGASAETLFALERLAGAAHNLFYRPARATLRGLGDWALAGFPRTVRRLWLPIAIASVLLYAPAVVTYVLLRTDPGLEPMLVSPEIIARAEKALEPGTDYRDTWGDVWLGSTFLSSAIIANNIQVSFIAFAGGILAGLPTCFMLVFNGMHLGSALGVFANRGVLDNIGLFVLPHGVIELTAIAIVGGAGLWMGSALFLPGRKRRLVALVERARDAGSLVAGVVMMLLVAGLIEGFISPARIPTVAKLAAAALAAALMVTYLLGAGRRRVRAD